MKLTSIISITIISILMLSGYVMQASAQTPSCPFAFGGGLICKNTESISIDKKVIDPSTNAFGDDIVLNLNPDTELSFQITVKNTSDKDRKNIKIIDTSTSPIEFISSNVDEDINKENITLTIEELKKGESKTVDLKVKVTSDSTQNGCIYNSAQISIDNQTAVDTVRICPQENSDAKLVTVPSTNPDQSSGQADTNSNTTQTRNQNSLSTTQNSNTQINNQTKGGKNIYTPTSITSSPDTGAGFLSLITIISSGITGLIFRKRIL